MSSGAAAVEAARGGRHLVAQPDEQRRRRAGVQRHLEGLAQLGVELGVGPAEQPRHERGVGRGGDRQQLGGPVEHPQRHGVAQLERPRVRPAHPRRARGCGCASSGRRGRRRRGR